MIWFTADQHFDHENILEYCQRPFNKLHIMNHSIINKFNLVVGKNDLTYHLGDFTLRGPENKSLVERWVKQLNGKHILILGNHDKLKPFDYVDIGFMSVHTYLKVEEFHLIHDPAVSTIDRENFWLCGHIHNLFLKLKNVINVGVDIWSFCPVSINCLRSLKEN